MTTTRNYRNVKTNAVAELTIKGGSVDVKVWVDGKPETAMSWRTNGERASATLKAFRTDEDWEEAKA